MGFSSRSLIIGFGVLVLVLSCYVQEAQAEDRETLNVFIIPHSHCDPGWLNTFEGYFRDQVNRILTGVVEKLLMDSTKKFVWAEISFFELWYDKQTKELREAIRKIVDNGQLEFVAGGWVQNDEANANFDIVIDQITEGHEFLLRTFGVVPRVAWQIDPFGHSSLTPSLFARMGFEAVVINRIHFNLKQTLKNNKQMEFLWQGSPSLGNESEIFTHVLHTHYSAPKGFDWEEGNAGISSGNVQHRSKSLADQMRDRANAYRTNNLLVPFGDDFKFQNPGIQFSNMDQLIEYINGHKKEFNMNIQYSTVAQYFDAVFKSSREKKTVFPKYEGDFFPYADNADAYWTGYYTTRPYLKGHSRGTDSHLKAAEGLYALGRTATKQNETSAVNWASLFVNIMQARRDAALVQHHDGITGTAKSFVASDYATRLDNARSTARQTIKEMMQVLLTDKEAPELYDRTLLDFSSEDEVTYSAVVHNPLGWTRRKYIGIQVNSESVTVTDASGVIIPSQVVPAWKFEKHDAEEYLLYFMVEVQPLALRTYFISKSTSILTAALPTTVGIFSSNDGGSADVAKLGSARMSIENEHIEVLFSNTTGLIAAITNKDSDIFLPIEHELVDYTTHGSGAYIFRPTSQAATFDENVQRTVHLFHGSLVSQSCLYIFKGAIHPEASVCFRVFSTKTVTDTTTILEVGGYVQIIYNIGSTSNHETVARYSTNMATDGKFYTDNGLEIRGRKRIGHTQQDFYPNPALCYLQDSASTTQLTIMSRQSMGTSSPKDGSIEMMMHRNLRQDDGRGLGEPNNDGQKISVQVLLMVQPADVSSRIARRLALQHQHYPRVMLGTAESRASWVALYNTEFEPMASQLPPNTHLLSFKARDAHSDDVIIRFAHIFEAAQHPVLSRPSEIKWERLFKSWDAESKRERSLAVTMNIDTAMGRRPKFAASNEFLPHQSGLPVTRVKGESQNTEEEGVFISQASLDDKKKASEQNNNPSGRKLLAFGDMLADPPLIMKPMQIKTFLAHLDLKQANSAPKAVLPSRATASPDTKINPSHNSEKIKNNNVDTQGVGSVEELSNYEISGQISALLVVSIVCTGLMVLAYTQLRRKAERRREANAKRVIV